MKIKNMYFNYYPDEKNSNIYYELLNLGVSKKRDKQYETATRIYQIIEKEYGETGILNIAKAKNYASQLKIKEAIHILKHTIEYCNFQDTTYFQNTIYHYQNLKEIEKEGIQNLSDSSLKYLTSISGNNSFEVFDTSKYQNAVVIFIDLLGTKEAENNFSDLLNINIRFKNILQRLETSFSSDNYIRKIFTFSDCCYIIIRQKYKTIDLKHIVFETLYDFTEICVTLLNDRIVFRGGIAIGDVWYDNDGFFGPAVNRAYTIESKEMKYIGIGLDETVVNLFNDKYNEVKNKKIENGYPIASCERDNHKIFYLNIFYGANIGIKYLPEKQPGNMLENTKKFIEERLHDYKDNSYILEKYSWFYDNCLCNIKISNETKLTVFNGQKIEFFDN